MTSAQGRGGDGLCLSRLPVTALAANNGFESGSDETTITTGNSGPDAFDAVLLGAGNALVYDSARAAHGVLSARIDLGAASGSTASMQWTFTEATEVWGWFYVFITGNPGAGLRICGGEQAGLGNWRMNLAVTGQIQVLDQNFAGAVNTTAAVPQNVWHRVGWRVLCSETVGQIEARIYEGDSTTPITDGTCSTDAVRDTGTGMDRSGFGCNAGWSAAAYTYWMDDLNTNVTGDFGPPGSEPTLADNPPMRRGGRGAGW